MTNGYRLWLLATAEETQKWLDSFGRLPDGGGVGQEGFFGIEGRLFGYECGRLGDPDSMVGDDHPVAGSAGKEGRAGKIGSLVVGGVVVVGAVVVVGVCLFRAAAIVRAAGHARKEQDVQGEKKQEPFHGAKVGISRLTAVKQGFIWSRSSIPSISVRQTTRRHPVLPLCHSTGYRRS